MSGLRVALVQASGLSYFLIIVGVGDANFRDMNIRVGDVGILSQEDIRRRFGGTMDSKSALRSAGAFSRTSEPSQRCPGLMKGLKA
ncbi:copine-7 [Plakobranchus ocellatus]|uniref:Copine-7 n=1 Tax=Plakobranchus ocellatus TaxID=259542 RepID=A0AAV4D9F4_9GAST|nr:copine-7 [Plakobranchus ocellatus]